MKTTCRFGWHEWTKWEFKDNVVISVMYPGYSKDYVTEKVYEIQQRECIHCGIKKMRRERR